MSNKGKIVIYQVLPRLYGNMTKKTVKDGSIKQNGCGKFNDFTAERLADIASLGATHIWYTGVLEHATKTDYSAFGIAKDHPAVVKGNAGSPYAVKDYYDVDPDLAVDVTKRVAEYEALIARTHEAGLKVIMDFIPNHVARHYVSDAKPKGVIDLGEKDITDCRFRRDNNFYYLPGQSFSSHGGQFDDLDSDGNPYHEEPCKVTGDDCYSCTPSKYNWYETVKLNYGRDYTNGGHLDIYPEPATWKMMLEILMYWAAKGVDGFRCDMAEMVPVEFWRWAIPQVKAKYKKIIFIAETYDPNQYRTYTYGDCFDYLYDKVGLYDTVRAVVECKGSAAAISDNWKRLDGLAPHMLTFMENHDEQRIASPHVAGSAIKVRPAMFVTATVSNAPTMIYFGQEFGEPALGESGFSGDDGRTTIFDYAVVPSVQRKLQGKLKKDEAALEEYYRSLLCVVRDHDCFSVDSQFYDLMYANYQNMQIDIHRQYAYIRKSKKHMLLMVVNFKDEQTKTLVNIPSHAFEYLKVKEGEVTATELLTKKKVKINLSASSPVELTLPAQSGVILEIKL